MAPASPRPWTTPTRLDRFEQRAFSALLAMPAGLTRRLAGRPHIVDGQQLDPQIQVGLRVLSHLGGPELNDLPVAQARAVLERESWLFGRPLAPVATSRNLLLPGPGGAIPARLHLPQRRAPGPLPLLIWYHGGGWVLGSIATHESLARAFCHLAGSRCSMWGIGWPRSIPSRRRSTTPKRRSCGPMPTPTSSAGTPTGSP